MEFRNEESVDVSPYVFDRNLQTIVVPLDEKLLQVKNDFTQVSCFLKSITVLFISDIDFRNLHKTFSPTPDYNRQLQ